MSNDTIRSSGTTIMRPAIMAVQRLARQVGLDISRYPGQRLGPQRSEILEKTGTTVAIDIGANRGQWGREAREWGYHGRLVSFEPGNRALAELRRVAAMDTNWEVRSEALGDQEGEAVLNIAANGGASSSILSMHDSHICAAPHAQFTATERVEQTTLAVVWPELISPEDRVFLKLDVQGFEGRVLDGAPDLQSVCAIELELSFLPLYVGGMLFDEAMRRMTDLGFSLAIISPSFSDRDTGVLLQADGIFVRA